MSEPTDGGGTEPYWHRWTAVVETRLSNLEHGQADSAQRLAVIEHDQKSYIASVGAMREYFDRTLAVLRDDMTGGFARLTRIIELHAQRMDEHEETLNRAQGIMAVLLRLLPILYVVAATATGYLMNSYGIGRMPHP